MLDLLLLLVGRCANITDDLEKLQVLRHRTMPKDSADVYQALLEDDVVLDVMDRDDKTAAEKQIIDCKKEETTRIALHAAVKERRAAVKARAAEGGSRRGVQSKKSSGGPSCLRVWKGPKELLDEIPEQYEVTGLLPPGASIWKARSHCAWAAHFPPWPRTSASWSLYGHREALRRVLATVWTQYLEDQELTPADCPIAGIFPDSSVATAAAAARSSAASRSNGP